MGLSPETIDELGEELLAFHQEFAPLFKTRTRDVSEHAFTALKGSVLMEGKRTYTGVAQKIVDPLGDGQNIQHFMSDSPWGSQRIFDAIQGQIGEHPELQGGMLNRCNLHPHFQRYSRKNRRYQTISPGETLQNILG